MTSMRVCAVGSPKGGVGKTTTAVTLAAIAARGLGLRVMLVDCDSNRSALDWTERAGDAIPVDAVDGQDLTRLRQLRRATGYDLAVLDLPGAREGAFQAILTGHGSGGPVADLLVVPTEPEVMSVTPVQRVIRHEVAPLGLAHLLVLCRVDPRSLLRAASYRDQLREHYGLTVAETPMRSLITAYRDARERSVTVLDVGGAHSYARVAEADCRALAAETLAAPALGFDTTPLRPEVMH